ncbi:MAG: AAA family ATPase, partial [Alphaproteobacteria bacterium]|nr:AAA family ATPase [Alphaproteobacteria bacterium]
FVAKYMGDGVLIYFGYPEAHEDDAERAARAGLAVIDAVGRLATQEPLNMRIGIATGLVVVGDLIGAGAAQERGVVGETPNLAARLQALARPGTLVVADATRRQIGTLFEIEDLGPQPLAGFAEPQRAWRVVGESGVVSRFEALRSRTTPLVGRDEELDLLTRRWQQAKLGEGRVVLVSGEPGIGKSRLTVALSQRIETEPHTRLRYFCSPHHQDSALYPFIGQLERAAGFTRDDTNATRLDKLEALLGDGAEPGDLSLLAEMLSLSGSERFPPLDLSPQRKKERTLAALRRQLQALARRQPILMIFEDLHWIDPTSREVLDLTVEKITELPVLMVATYRPEFQPPWVGGSQVTVIALNRLGRSEGATLVYQLAGNLGALPPDIVDEIVERTDGVPLFVEELTKAVVEAGADRGYVSISAVPPSSLAVPATLHASLLGRLDRLGPAAKNVAQVGAAIGREFSHELLAAAVRLAEPDLQEALRRLVEAGLVFQRGAPPAAEYLFKHALVQDTAYSTLLRGPRQALHRRIAATLQERFPDRVASEPEALARHFSEALQPDRAWEYWLEAGRRAAERSANPEAIGHLTKALQTLELLPESAERDRQELTIRNTIGTPLIAMHGYASPEAGVAFNRARVLSGRLGDASALFATLSGEWAFHYVRGDHRMMREVIDEAESAAKRRRNEPLDLVAYRCGGQNALYFGEFEA